MKKIFFALVILAIILTADYITYKDDKIDNTSQKKSLNKRTVAQLMDSKYILMDIDSKLSVIKDEVVHIALFEAAKWYIPNFLKELEINKDVYDRLIFHLKNKNFKDNIIPFLIHSRAMYYDKKNHLDAGFKNYILKYFPDSKEHTSSFHSLFDFKVSKDEKENDNNSKRVLRERMKFFISEFLNLYDVLFLQKISSSNINEKQVSSLKKSFEKILIHVEPMVNTNPDVKEAISNLKKDESRKETISLAIGQFINMFLRKHFQIFSHHFKHKYIMHQWLSGKVDEYVDNQNNDILDYLNYQQSRNFAIHIIVDGLQGNLIKALVGKNDLYLNRIIQDAENFRSYKPKSETVTTLAPQKIDFLKSLKKSPELINHSLYLPFFKSLHDNYGQLWAEQGISTTPTISVRNLPMAMTGVDVVGKESTGLPNFHYVDRKGEDSLDKKERAYYFFGNDALKLEEITQVHGMKTMFTRLKEHGIYGLACNTNYDKDAIVSFDALLNLALGEKVRDFGEINCMAEIHRRIKNEKKLHHLRSELIKELVDLKRDWKSEIINKFTEWKNKAELKILIKDIAKLEPMSLPSYMQIYIPWPDHFAHFEGPHSDAIISQTGELNRLDYWLYQLDQLFYKNKLHDRTAFAMAGDHGLTPVYYVLNPEVTVLEKFSKENNIPLKINKISSDEGEGPKLNHPNYPETMRGYDVVIASTAGGNYMLDFFLDHKKDSQLWKTQPVLDDLIKLKTLSGHKINVPKILTDYLPETLDYLVVRNKPCNANFSDISIIAKRNAITYREVIKRQGSHLYYKASKGKLLDLGLTSTNKYFDFYQQKEYQDLVKKCTVDAKELEPATWCDENTWRNIFHYTDRPDALNQLAHLYDTDKAGTINLFPRMGIGYNTKVPGRHAGESFDEKDAFVAFWGGKSNKYANSLQNAINGQIAPTLFYFLTQKEDTGFGFKPIKDIFIMD